jgi:hypothetical protein
MWLDFPGEYKTPSALNGLRQTMVLFFFLKSTDTSESIGEMAYQGSSQNLFQIVR